MGRMCWQCAQADNTKRNKLRYNNKQEECRAYHAKAKILRRKNNPLAALADAVRSRTYAAFKYKGYTKRSQTFIYLGISFEELKKYLEVKFTQDMSWDNYGLWHVDHITPLTRAKNIEELERLCHYTNLQPLWAVDNLKKGTT